MAAIREIVPEFNFWVNRTLYNNDVNQKFSSYPVIVSDFWRCKDSVIELLFNETADPSGNVYDDGYHFIYKYRTVNLNKINTVDPTLWRRIQIYRTNMRVFSAIDDKFKDIQNLVVNPEGDISSSSTITTNDIHFTKYVTKYRSRIITSGNEQVHQELPDGEDESESEEDPCVLQRGENIFLLTNEELQMCEYLYLYRTNQFELIEPFDDNFYYTLESPLSKWIYLYLQCYLFNIVNYEYLNKITNVEDGCIRLYAEKYFSDRIYVYIQKQHTMLWNNIIDIGTKEERIFVDETEYGLTCLHKGRLSNLDVQNKEIILKEDSSRQPIENRDFEFIYDGIKLKQGVDYTLVNVNNLSNPQIVIKINKDLEENQKYQLIWCYMIPTTPDNRIKGFSDGK